MGLNILIARHTASRFCAVEYPDFDTDKYTGDEDFASYVAHTGIGMKEIGEHEFYYRPIVDDTQKWVQAHIQPEGNQERLLRLLTISVAVSLFLVLRSIYDPSRSHRPDACTDSR